jgi:hypothetical protein
MLPEYLDTFPGAIVRFVLDELLKMDMAASAWSALSDQQREERTDTLARRADELAGKLVEDVVAAGYQVVRGTLESVVFKDGLKLTIKAGRSEADRHAIADAAGGAIMVVLPQKIMDLQTSAGAPSDVELPLS